MNFQLLILPFHFSCFRFSQIDLPSAHHLRRSQHERWKVLIRVENSQWPLAGQKNTNIHFLSDRKSWAKRWIFYRRNRFKSCAQLIADFSWVLFVFGFTGLHYDLSTPRGLGTTSQCTHFWGRSSRIRKQSGKIRKGYFIWDWWRRLLYTLERCIEKQRILFTLDYKTICCAYYSSGKYCIYCLSRLFLTKKISRNFYLKFIISVENRVPLFKKLFHEKIATLQKQNNANKAKIQPKMYYFFYRWPLYIKLLDRPLFTMTTFWPLLVRFAPFLTVPGVWFTVWLWTKPLTKWLCLSSLSYWHYWVSTKYLCIYYCWVFKGLKIWGFLDTFSLDLALWEKKETIEAEKPPKMQMNVVIFGTFSNFLLLCSFFTKIVCIVYMHAALILHYNKERRILE